MNAAADYGDEHIRTLDWKEHIRRRPGMYIGKLGDGTSADDGIYILIKEVLDNSIDEYMMGFGKTIDVTVGDDGRVSVRDYGRGIPLGKLVDVASKMNTGAKYDSKAFKKSVGLNGVGIKAVNALSSEFTIRSVRDGEARTVRFEAGEEISDTSESGVGDRNGTSVSFVAVAAVAAGGYEEQQAPAPGLGQRVSGRLADPVSLEADQRSVDIQKKSFDHSVVFRNSYSAGIARQR